MDYDILDKNIVLTTTTLSLSVNTIPSIFDQNSDSDQNMSMILNKIAQDYRDFLFDVYYNYIKKDSKKDAQKGVFYNCVLIKITNTITNSKYSIKIFKNGSIIITGITDKVSENQILNLVGSLSNCPEIAEDRKDNIKYVMINGKIKLGPINLRSLKLKLEEYSIVKYSTYDPENYKGLIIKTCNLGTIIVFGTGSILLSSNSFNNLNELKDFIIKVPEISIA